MVAAVSNIRRMVPFKVGSESLDWLRSPAPASWSKGSGALSREEAEKSRAEWKAGRGRFNLGGLAVMLTTRGAPTIGDRDRGTCRYMDRSILLAVYAKENRVSPGVPTEFFFRGSQFQQFNPGLCWNREIYGLPAR